MYMGVWGSVWGCLWSSLSSLDRFLCPCVDLDAFLPAAGNLISRHRLLIFDHIGVYLCISMRLGLFGGLSVGADVDLDLFNQWIGLLNPCVDPNSVLPAADSRRHRPHSRRLRQYHHFQCTSIDLQCI